MKINFELDDKCTELKILVSKNVMDEEVQDVMNKLSVENVKKIMGYREKEIYPIDINDIYRLYSQNNKVVAVLNKEEFEIKHKLYELEEMLDENIMTRISNSEFINVSKVSKFDLSISGTIKVILNNGDSAFVSRRYVSKIKKNLGI